MNLATAVSGVAAIGGLFNGTVSVGGIFLSGLEVPEKLNWGGAQKTTVHKLPGGARVIDAMGPDDAEIKWTGFLSGPLANYGARALDAMRSAGVAVPLSWPGFTRTVVISSFTVTSERNGFWLPYSIGCIVQPMPAGPPQPGLLGQVAADVSSALGLDMSTLTPVLQTAQAAVAQVQAVLPVVGVLTGGSPAFASVAGAVGLASGAVSMGLASTETAMGPLLATASVTGTPLGATTPASGLAALRGALTGSQSLAGLTNMAAPLARMTVNLNNAGG
jgi:hypothetical protein